MAFPFFGDDKSTVARLLATLPQVGRLEWIGRRAVRRQPPVAVLEANVQTDSHLLGDHARPKAGGKRQITFIQHEHLAEVAGYLGLPAPVDPGRLRRNLVVSGLNLSGAGTGSATLLRTGTAGPSIGAIAIDRTAPTASGAALRREHEQRPPFL